MPAPSPCARANRKWASPGRTKIAETSPAESTTNFSRCSSSTAPAILANGGVPSGLEFGTVSDLNRLCVKLLVLGGANGSGLPAQNRTQRIFIHRPAKRWHNHMGWRLQSGRAAKYPWHAARRSTHHLSHGGRQERGRYRSRSFGGCG